MVGSVSLQNITPKTPIYVGSQIIDEKPVSVMAFGTAKDLGVEEDNSKVHFYTGYTETKNAQIVEAESAAINGSSLAVYPHGFVRVAFDLSPQDLEKNLGLYLTHRTSSSGRGSNRPSVNIFVNGHLLARNYVPNNLDWVNDQVGDNASFSSLLVQGRNTVFFYVHPDDKIHSARARNAQYLIHSLMVK